MSKYIELDSLRKKITSKRAETNQYWTSNLRTYLGTGTYFKADLVISNYMRGYCDAVSHILSILDAMELTDSVDIIEALGKLRTLEQAMAEGRLVMLPRGGDGIGRPYVFARGNTKSTLSMERIADLLEGGGV